MLLFCLGGDAGLGKPTAGFVVLGADARLQPGWAKRYLHLQRHFGNPALPQRVLCRRGWVSFGFHLGHGWASCLDVRESDPGLLHQRGFPGHCRHRRGRGLGHLELLGAFLGRLPAVLPEFRDGESGTGGYLLLGGGRLELGLFCGKRGVEPDFLRQLQQPERKPECGQDGNAWEVGFSFGRCCIYSWWRSGFGRGWTRRLGR